MKRIIAVGACYMDTILTVPHYPHEDDKLRATSLTRRRGGNCPNTLEVLQQLIPRDSAESCLSLVAVLPHPHAEDTKFIIRSLENVTMDTCIYRPHRQLAASSFIIRSQETNSRTIVNYNELGEMTVREFKDKVWGFQTEIGDLWNIYHFEGRIPDVTLKCIQELQSVEVYSPIISVEIEKPGREGLEDLAKLANIVFYSKSWAQGKGYRTARECLEAQMQPPLTLDDALLCCTWGAEGATALQKRNTGFECVSVKGWAEDDRPVIDTIGAGDTFIAGMLYGLNYHKQDWTLYEKLEFANELAGRKVRQEGFDGLGEQMGIHFETRPSCKPPVFRPVNLDTL